MTVASTCKSKYPTPDTLDKAIADGKSQIAGSGTGPNAQRNFLHWLDNSGTELLMPTAVFENHKATKEALGTQREKFLDGTRNRLQDGRLKPGEASETLRWTGHANAFGFIPPPPSDDLAYAVGGFQLCSNVKVVATPLGTSRFRIQFLKWQAQAFDCYNWDPWKGIGKPGIDDTTLCCIENAGKAKHFLIRTPIWENKDIDSLKEAEISATLPAPKVPVGPGAPTGGKPPAP
jgi:hypothetical protein